MPSYAIYLNEYCHAQATASEIKDFFKNHNFVEDKKNPDLAVIIGGDGTFLKAIHHLWNNLEKSVFVGINAGLVGFYSSFRLNQIKELKQLIQQHEWPIREYPLLEANFNNNQTAYAINEIKVVNNIKTLSCTTKINTELLQNFRGSGMVFCTNSGSTGYMRSVNGAIILSENEKLWEMQELAPVSNFKFSTINSPIVLDASQEVTLEGKFDESWLVPDTFQIPITHKTIKIKLAKIKCKIMINPAQKQSKIWKWNQLL